MEQIGTETLVERELFFDVTFASLRTKGTVLLVRSIDHRRFFTHEALEITELGNVPFHAIAEDVLISCPESIDSRLDGAGQGADYAI